MAEVTLADIRAGERLPATGTAHGHVRLANGLLARVAYAHEGDATAAGRLHAQAAAFHHLEPAHRSPRLHGIVEPMAGLPGGALIVDCIDGHTPGLPGDLGAMAETLALIHSLPLPPTGSSIPRQNNPLLETLQVIELAATHFLDKAVSDNAARAEIVDELWQVREMAATLELGDQPLTVALADTHPGNFLVDRAGIAWFVDLEKVHVGSAAIDLAHATLLTSTLWDPRVGKELSAADIARFNEAYLARRGEEDAAALRPWLMPMRRLTWLRTTMFMARWRVQTREPRDRHDPTQWSDAGLDPGTKAHIDARIDRCFTVETIRSIRSEWL